MTMTNKTEMTGLDPVARLARDLRKAAVTLTDDEARYFVDTYYAMQEDRIRAANQVRALSTSGEPHTVVSWLADQASVLETNIKAALGHYADGRVVGAWSQRVPGIGPILAAGLLAHIDIARAPTVGHIWRFAGLDPTVTWAKGQKRPWNARLKVVCWKVGESFVKVSGSATDVYGKVYVARKAQEVDRNERGLFRAQAEVSLASGRFKRETATKEWYEQGKLPPARLHLRAKRYAVKLFLAHWHHVAFVDKYGTEPPKPYIIEHGGHVDFIAPPFWP